MAKEKADEWLDKLVKKYKVPVETETKPKKILKESQLKIILNKK